MLGQALGAQRGKDPLDGVGMRRGVPAAAVLAGAHAGQQFPLRVDDPVGDLDQGHAPAEHRRGAQSQDRGQRMANPPLAAGVGDRGEPVQQALTAGAQPARPADQDRHRRLGVVLPRSGRRSGRHSGQGHDRLSRQRSHRFRRRILDSPVSYRGSVARTARHAASVINL